MDAMASADPTTGHDRDKALVASSCVTTPPGNQGTVASYPLQTFKGSRTISSLAPGSAAGATAAVNNGPVMSKGLTGATAPPLSSSSVIQTRPANPQSVAPPGQHVSNATGPTVTLARPPMQTAGSGATLNGSPAGVGASARQTGAATQTPYVNNGQSVCAGSHAPAIIQAAPRTTVAPCDAHVPTTAAVGPGGIRTLHPQMLPQRLPQPPVGQPGVHNIQIPHGKVLVRNERGQLLLIPQQALAQIQAQSQAQGGMAPRTAAPTNMTPGQCLGNAIINRPVSSMVRQGCPAPTSLAATTTLHRPAVLQSSVGASVPGMIPRTITQTAGTTVTSVTVSKETMENVMKCKSFLSTLIKLASSGKQSVETAANVRALVKDLLEDKLEAEEFTSRLYKELHSSPQPYLVTFLKRSLPALRQLTPDSAAFIQQSQHLQLASAPVPSTAAPRLTVPPCRPQLQPGVSKPGQTSSMVIQPQQQRPLLRPQVTLPVTPMVTLRNQAPGHIMVGQQQPALNPALKNKLKEAGGTFKDDEDINDVASMAGVNLTEESANILATNSGLVGVVTHSCKDEAFLSSSALQRRMLEIGKRYGVTDLGAEVVNFVSHATQQRLQNLLEKVSHVAQQRNVNFKEDDRCEQSSDVRAQLRFFEQLDQLEKQRKEEQEREILLRAAKSRARQEDPEQLRLKQKAKEMQQQELAQMRHREANLAALAAIGPRKKRKILDSSSSSVAAEGSGPGSSLSGGAAPSGSRSTRQRITRVNLRDLLFCLENERCTSRSHFLYKGFLK